MIAPMPSSRSVTMSQVALAIVALLAVTIPSENGVSIPGVGSLSRLVGFAAIAMTLMSLFDRGRLRFRAPSLFLVTAALFVAWSAATYFWSIAPTTSLSRTVQYAQLFALAWMIHQLARTDRQRDLLLQAFVIGAYVMIAVAVAAYFGSSRIGYRDVGFPANSFAIVAALTIPMAWSLVIRRPVPFLHLLNVAYPLFALLAVVLAASRGGLLTAVAALTIIPLTLLNVGVALRTALLVAVCAFGVVGVAWLPSVAPDLERNLERLGRVDEDLLEGTMTGRTQIWDAGFQVFASSPVIGIGSGGFNQAVEPLLGSARSAHNAFLSVAVTSGLIGVFLFGAMFVIVLVGAVRQKERRVEHLVLLMALVVASMPANAENAKHLWFVLAILASARPVTVTIADTPADRRLGSPRHTATSASRPTLGRTV